MSKRKHQQQFKEEYGTLWPVLKKSKVSATHAYCSVCDVDISISHGGKDDCRRHVGCARHVEKSKIISSHKNLKSLFVQSDDLNVIKAEALFTIFLIEHNIPLSAADHAGPLFERMFPDSEIASKYGCARTKTTAIIKSFSDSSVEEITNNLKTAKFSLSTDGSNSSENEKLFPVLVTYLDISLEKNVTMMLSLPKLNGDGTGKNIFSLLDAEFQKYAIPWKNCVAFCSDNASVMTGKLKGVIKFIKEKNPNIILNGCVCHLIHLVAQHSSKKLDFALEEFLVDIFYYLKKSSKRLESLKLCQELCEVEIHKILKYGSTRWLSMERVVNRVLEQWEPLKMFFCEKEVGDSDALLRIKKKFQDPVSQLYLLFLQSIIPIFTKANAFLQQEAPLIHKLQKELIFLYSNCLSRFLKPSAILNSDSIFDIDFADRKIQKSRKELIIGYKTKQYLNDSTLTDREKKKFFTCVRSFYLEACSYMVKKFPMKDELLRHAEVANIHMRAVTTFKSLKFFLDLFSETLTDDEINAVEAEFALYQTDKLTDEILNCEREDEAWCKIKNIEDHNRAVKYKILPNIMLNILVLPHSNAACERVFSTVRKNQNEFRSKLGRQTLESLMIQKCKFSSNNICCYKQNFSENELRKAKKATYLSLSTS